VQGHEYPDDMPFCHRPLLAGEVYSVEPGIYVYGLGGFRIDDTVVIGQTPEIITKDATCAAIGLRDKRPATSPARDHSAASRRSTARDCIHERRSSRRVRQNAAPPLRRKAESGVWRTQ